MTRRSLITALGLTASAAAQTAAVPVGPPIVRLHPCPVCKTPNSQPGAQLLMVDVNNAPVTVPSVVALICSNCGVVYTVTA